MHGHEYGGTNPALLKALAYGSAIFAIDTVFSREVLSNQEYGVIFKKEENHLASLIKKHEIDESILIMLRNKGRDLIDSKYNWDSVADNYKKLIIRSIDE